MWGFLKIMLDIRASLCGAPDYESGLKVVRRALVSRYVFRSTSQGGLTYAQTMAIPSAIPQSPAQLQDPA